MGVLLDTSILIAGERRKRTARQVLDQLYGDLGHTEVSLSTISLVELTHGVYPARTAADRERRMTFRDELCRDMIVHPVSLEIAQLAGRVEGEQAAPGVTVAFQDLVIGATALYLGLQVATLNLRHFRLIPGLSIVPF